MTQLTFDQLPHAVGELADKLNNIEKLLQSRQDNSNMIFDKPLSIEEASEYINLAVPTIYGLVGRSAIPVSKKGKRLYFSKSELDAWIKSGRQKTTSELEDEADAFLSSRKK